MLLAAASALFFARGPWRALHQSGDFAPAYLSTRLWLRGSNPYDHEQFAALWQAAGGLPADVPTKETTPSVYPPTAFVVVAPLALLPWNAARLALTLLNTALALLAIGALSRAAGLRWNDGLGRCFWALALAFAPLHSGLATGNLIIIAASCALLAVWAAMSNKEWMASLLLAVATGVKPHVGGVFVLAYALQGRWRLSAVSIGWLLLLSVISLVPLEMHRVSWLGSLLASHAAASAPGGVNDPTGANPSQHHLINLQRLLFTFLTQSWFVNAIAVGLTALLLVAWLVATRHRGSERRELLFLSALVTVSLLPIYHRFYDAMVLLLPLAWCLAAWSGRWRAEARLGLLCLAPLLVPGAALLHEALRAGRIPVQWAATWWWKSVLMPHQVWAVLLLAIVLISALTKRPVEKLAGKIDGEACVA